MGTVRNVFIQARRSAGSAERPIEMCEHKGVGHPDTITDGACQAAARALLLAYEAAVGRVLHFNLDKGLLVAGRSVPCFGGGAIIEPIKLIVCGRATPCPDDFDLPELVTEAVIAFLADSVRVDPALFQVVPEVKAGSANLASIYASARAVANDTSFGVGFAPLTALEQQVLDTAAMLCSDTLRTKFPAAGDDYKIMGLRVHDELRLTVAVALIDRHINNVAHYIETREAIAAYLARALPARSVLQLNCLDQRDAHDEEGLYLTVTGLSAEMGDDGQVGRGNRVNGLITPGRPMSLEAAAGKNPVSHVGKIYNVLADALARDIVARIEGVGTVEVQLLSRIGQPLDQPQMALIEVGPGKVLTAAVRQKISTLANAWFDRIDQVTSDLAHGRMANY
jgi:S-adenosylmethionine synthetase